MLSEGLRPTRAVLGQTRGMVGTIKHDLKRRAAIQAVIGHMKTDGSRPLLSQAP
jgi:hypothetical protein